MCLEGD
ncbi:hypothetical protein VTH06DRAFT_5710 [Thermothelomyces fergusii]